MRTTRWSAVGCAVAAALALAGCDSIGFSDGTTPSGTSATSSSSTTSGTTGSTVTASASPTTAFGRDAVVPADGVGVVTASSLDTWTLENRRADVFAEYLAPVDTPGFADAQQAQISGWLTLFRSTPVPGPASPTSAATSAPTTAGSVSPTSGSASGSATSSTASAGPPLAAATRFRVVPQLLAASSQVSAVRLYGRWEVAGVGVEHYRTLWYDRARRQVVDGTALFAAQTATSPDPLGKARQSATTALAAAGAPAALTGVSDRDLFSAAAFTPAGDLVLYLAGDDGPIVVTLPRGDIEPLLSDLGRQAASAARDAVVAGSASSSSSSTRPPSGTSSVSSTTSSTASSTG